jgi:hypothetical protein
VPANSGGGFDSLDAATQESFRKEAPPRIGAPKDIDLGGTDGFTIRDNGDGTFNVGDLIVNGLTLASEIGCLVKVCCYSITASITLLADLMQISCRKRIVPLRPMAETVHKRRLLVRRRTHYQVSLSD